jgi:hypothetical protein
MQAITLVPAMDGDNGRRLRLLPLLPGDRHSKWATRNSLKISPLWTPVRHQRVTPAVAARTGGLPMGPRFRAPAATGLPSPAAARGSAQNRDPSLGIGANGLLSPRRRAQLLEGINHPKADHPPGAVAQVFARDAEGAGRGPNAAAAQHRLENHRGFRFKLVPGVGVEPTSPCGRRILSPLRLPISPSRLDSISASIQASPRV